MQFHRSVFLIGALEWVFRKMKKRLFMESIFDTVGQTCFKGIFGMSFSMKRIKSCLHNRQCCTKVPLKGDILNGDLMKQLKDPVTCEPHDF